MRTSDGKLLKTGKFRLYQFMVEMWGITYKQLPYSGVKGKTINNYSWNRKMRCKYYISIPSVRRTLGCNSCVSRSKIHGTV